MVPHERCLLRTFSSYRDALPRGFLREIGGKVDRGAETLESPIVVRRCPHMKCFRGNRHDITRVCRASRVRKPIACVPARRRLRARASERGFSADFRRVTSPFDSTWRSRSRPVVPRATHRVTCLHLAASTSGRLRSWLLILSLTGLGKLRDRRGGRTLFVLRRVVSKRFGIARGLVKVSHSHSPRIRRRGTSTVDSPSLRSPGKNARQRSRGHQRCAPTRHTRYARTTSVLAHCQLAHALATRSCAQCARPGAWQSQVQFAHHVFDCAVLEHSRAKRSLA